MSRFWLRLAVVCLLAAAGCGGDDTSTGPAPSPSTAGGGQATAAPAPPPSEPPVPKNRFVSTVREQLPLAAEGRPDDEVAALATRACRRLAAGDDAAVILAQMQSLGTLDADAIDEASARELVKLAIDTDCLDQAARVDEFGR